MPWTAWNTLSQRLSLTMQHDLTLEGPAFRLRPIRDDDAQFVLKLRCDPSTNQFLHATSTSLEDQLAWFSHYYKRTGDYYFVVERRSNMAREGVISIYDIDFEKLSGEWGRWLVKPGSLSAVESVLLIYRVAFTLLGLSSVCCRTVSDNKSVVSFHDSCLIKHRRLLPRHFNLGGRTADAIEHTVNRESWGEIDSRLEQLAQVTAHRLNRV